MLWSLCCYCYLKFTQLHIFQLSILHIILMVHRVKAVWILQTDTSIVDNNLKSIKTGSIHNFTENGQLEPQTLMSVIASEYRYVHTTC
jgi:hypothetical protein